MRGRYLIDRFVRTGSRVRFEALNVRVIDAAIVNREARDFLITGKGRDLRRA